MNQQANIFLRSLMWVLFGIAAATPPLLFFRNDDKHEPANDTRKLLDVWSSGQAAQFASGYRDMENTWSGVPEGTNVAMVYRNFDPSVEQHVKFISEFTHVAASWMLPRRLYAAYDGTPINDGKSIIAAHFDPTTRWLMERNVQTVFYARVTEQGAMEMLRVTLPRDPTPQQMDQPPHLTPNTRNPTAPGSGS